MRNNHNAVECRTRHFLHTLSTVNVEAEVGCDSSVCIDTRYGMDCPGSNAGVGRDFPHPSRKYLEPTEPPVTRVVVLFFGVKAAVAWR